MSHFISFSSRLKSASPGYDEDDDDLVIDLPQKIEQHRIEESVFDYFMPLCIKGLTFAEDCWM